MTPKERMLKTFSGEHTDRIPIAPHWWGVYKFELAEQIGISATLEQPGALLAEIDTLFYETFKPDWFHLGSGEWKANPEGDRGKHRDEILPAVKNLDSLSVIDEYLNLNLFTPEQVKETGVYDHVKILSSRYGEDVFIAMNEGNPVCGVLDPNGIIGFEEGLIALHEKPKEMERLIFGLYERRLDWVRVLAEYGCHGYLGSETYVGADLISPQTYRDVIFPAQQFFYEGVRILGMTPMIYFCGDINPLIPWINQLDVSALLVEEPKKTFELDVVEIRKRLAERITLFGNLDSVHTLRFGKREDVLRETKAQLKASFYGRFVMANGSPLTPETPRENITAMIETTREA